jgi:hypothetical protein
MTPTPSGAVAPPNIMFGGAFICGGGQQQEVVVRNNLGVFGMKLMTRPVAAAAMGVSMCVMAQSAQAREHHRYYVHHREAGSHHFSRHYASRLRNRHEAQQDNAYGGQQYAFGEQQYAYSDRSAYHGGTGPRPAAWCGWEMRQLVGSDPGPSFNLARNWARWGRSGPAGIGAVVVWSHHVGKIVGQEGGQWVIESGNDGHRLRSRPRSIAGAIAIRWG